MQRKLASIFGLFLLLLTTAAHGAQQVEFSHGKDVVEVEAIASNVLRVHVEPDGTITPRTLVLDPAWKPSVVEGASWSSEGSHRKTLRTLQMSVLVEDSNGVRLQVIDAAGKEILRVEDLLAQSHKGILAIVHDENEDLYGMRGLDRSITGASILRNGGAVVAAAGQGEGGAPFFFTKRYGVLVDSDGGRFDPLDGTLTFARGSRPDTEFFVIVGKPMQVMEGMTQLTGRPPMVPKWTLGFLNSQWGATEDELRQVAATYKEKQIPLSGFILDFDWKAWGEDNYGEWRWNSTSGPGNASPNKFPDGASGKFAAEMLGQGVHLAGILKPRILINNTDGTLTQAAAYATEHKLWYPGEVREEDYVTHRLAGNINFASAEARSWYWKHLVPAFQSGMTGWWLDEADQISKLTFNNFENFNMGRAIYDGQRALSQERVWTLNRTYYLGASRYGYAAWSGDILTGFQSMAHERRRMIASLDLGVQHWSMDAGGFTGHPTPENYARWVEFAAFVPTTRVHGNHFQKRQPWAYGPVAEAAAKQAIQLRYDLLPYIYSYERLTVETGIGIARPLFWEFPDDPQASSETRSWMFGDALLVSPIVEHGLPTHEFYLPPGRWGNYRTGEWIDGGKKMQVAIDQTTWKDIPIYVRDGSILALQPTAGAIDPPKRAALTLEVFPSAGRVARFAAYDDDGHTYAYERGEFFRQQIEATQEGKSTTLVVEARAGSYKTPIPSYLVYVHQPPAQRVTANGRTLQRFGSKEELLKSSAPGWIQTSDRFGSELLLRLPLGGDGNAVTYRID